MPTEVIIDDRASPRHTVIEVFAKDRPGLLYALAKAMHELGLSIALSKINTEGTRVADVFYVSEAPRARGREGRARPAVRRDPRRARAGGRKLTEEEAGREEEEEEGDGWCFSC